MIFLIFYSIIAFAAMAVFMVASHREAHRRHDQIERRKRFHGEQE